MNDQDVSLTTRPLWMEALLLPAFLHVLGTRAVFGSCWTFKANMPALLRRCFKLCRSTATRKNMGRTSSTLSATYPLPEMRRLCIPSGASAQPTSKRVSTWADALRRVLDNGVALPVLPQHAQVPSPGGWLSQSGQAVVRETAMVSFWTSAKPSPVFVWLTAAKATGHRTVDCASSFPWRASRSATITTEGAMLRESWCLHRLQSYRILAFAALP